MTATLQPIATAVQCVQSVLKRRPEAAVHDDAPATARWQGASRTRPFAAQTIVSSLRYMASCGSGRLKWWNSWPISTSPLSSVKEGMARKAGRPRIGGASAQQVSPLTP